MYLYIVIISPNKFGSILFYYSLSRHSKSSQKVVNKVEVKALCRRLEFLHCKMVTPCFYGELALYIVMGGQKKLFTKLLPQGWTTTIVYNVFVWWNNRKTLHWRHQNPILLSNGHILLTV